jgi:lj928 prophage protein|nr:MAG TPA: GDSL like Lipase Acylhydrolase [Caudoviricetes sp.]
MTNNIEARGDTRFYQDDTHMDYNKLYTIDEVLDAITQKKYGKDVRYALRVGLERVYHDAQANSSDNNLEVARARGAFEVLSDRLQSIDNSLNNKANSDEVFKRIQNIVDGSPKGTYPNLTALQLAKPNGEQGVFVTSDNGHWYYWDNQWRDGGVYQGKTVPEKSIGKVHFDFYSNDSKSANLFVEDNIVEGGFFTSSGTFTKSNNWGYVKINANPGEEFVTNRDFYYIAFFRGDIFVSGARSTPHSSFTIPSGVDNFRMPIPLLNNPEYNKLSGFGIIKGKYAKENIPQSKVDNSAYITAGNLSNNAVFPQILTGGKPLKINFIDGKWKLTIPPTTYVTYKDEFVGVVAETVILEGLTANTGSYLYFEPATKKIVEKTRQETSNSDSVILGISFSYENPSRWMIKTANPILIEDRICSQKWAGKKVACLGDSITQKTENVRKYYDFWKVYLSPNTILDYGVAGSSISRKTGEWPTWDTQVPFVERIKTIPKDIDVLTIFGGVNDWVADRTLGSLGDTEDTTFYGALDKMFKYATQNFQGKDIYVFTPLQNDWIKRPANDGTTDGRNRSGKYLKEYVEAIKQVAEKYAIPVCDLYSIMFYPFAEGFTEKYMPDGLHPNESAHKLMANKMANFIESH